MKILVTGRGGAAGSWTIRGEQIGGAIGARVQPKASLHDMREADVILVVKRVDEPLLADLRRSGKPWVYDIVDAYPQPDAARWSEDESKTWLRKTIASLNPTTVIWPNQRMRQDAEHTGKVVYHHARPEQPKNLVREHMSRVGYEGSPNYIGDWIHAIGAECERHGAVFMINPSRLSELDVVLAVRCKQWCGYPQLHWKSQVKLANAHDTGTPFIGLRECGYSETAIGGEVFVDSPKQLRAAFEQVREHAIRQQISAQFRTVDRSLARAAKEILEVLHAVVAS